MRRLGSVILLSLVMVCFCVNLAGAVPMFQDSGTASENVDLLRAVNVFSEIFTAGLQAAGAQLAAGYMYETPEGPEEPVLDPVPAATEMPVETVPDEPQSEPDTEPTKAPSIASGLRVSGEKQTEEPVLPEPEIPAPVIPEEPEPEASPEPVLPEEPEPEASPEPVIPEVTGPQEAQVFAPPSDPEQYAISFGVSVSRFYNAFKAEVKSRGVHSVGFEEKGRKSASKITVDSEIDVFTYYSKASGENLISRINFEAEIEDEKELVNTEIIFCSMLETLCGYYAIPYDDGVGSDLFDLVMADGSAVLGELLVYGSTEQQGKETELTVKIYRSGI